MEQTLGKRIAQHRKQLGLTQDQLADKLGITAQAVSKWENDLSCPDIATLPRLAEIFGISVDELLGREAPEKVHEAEVVDEDEGRSGIHFENNHGKSWDFHWDAGRRHRLLFPLFVLWVGGWTLAARVLEQDISLWSFLWPSAILFTGIGGLMHRKFSAFDLACILFGGYYFAVEAKLITVQISGDLVFPICIVLFGAGLLIDALRKPKKPRFRIHRNGNAKSQETKRTYHAQDEAFECSLSFGEAHEKVTLPRLAEGEITLSFGELTVDLSGCETVSEDCRIEASCSFGELTVLVPSRYCVVSDNSTAFASIDFHGHPDDSPVGTIRLDANASFGQIIIKYI